MIQLCKVPVISAPPPAPISPWWQCLHIWPIKYRIHQGWHWTRLRGSQIASDLLQRGLRGCACHTLHTMYSAPGIGMYLLLKIGGPRTSGQTLLLLNTAENIRELDGWLSKRTVERWPETNANAPLVVLAKRGLSHFGRSFSELQVVILFTQIPLSYLLAR